ncbi:glycosyl transferase [Prochlorococcus marinus]|uniref:glycosyl transferase n=1 Tax=Prochlorococcus marinus TaxID=1219 RepID=UPI001ADC23B3|nr:glycosyl transferase [Prochlorococcus marinus]MBO8204931.1 glycosyl transferase [Prochlorococcus marinus CUG1415]MBW3044203.1 glycosyl transferase [Prochlorococcus marinus str. MU1415]
MLLLFISTILGSFCFYLIYPTLKKTFLDYPVSRSSHTFPTPKGAGIIFALIGLIGSIIFKSKLILICLPLAIVGFIDDRYNLKRRLRFLIQLIISLLILNESSLFLMVFNYFQGNYILIVLLFFLTILGIISFINFTNFIDGLDGLICGCMIIAFSVESYMISSSLLSLIGSLIAFLPWNWSPAKLFMGDSGSTFLGATYIAYALNAYTFGEFCGLILVVTPIWADAFCCILRRLMNKQNIFVPHKLHLYQRLNLSGLSHSKVSLIYISSTLFISITLILLNSLYAFFSALIVILFGIYLDKKVAAKFQI